MQWPSLFLTKIKVSYTIQITTIGCVAVLYLYFWSGNILKCKNLNKQLKVKSYKNVIKKLKVIYIWNRKKVYKQIIINAIGTNILILCVKPLIELLSNWGLVDHFHCDFESHDLLEWHCYTQCPEITINIAMNT